ncbi:hypothetical protein FGB62_9g07 [Gracilaria domingensis]|nr:hypothetical protein FGB62_9g07 [Gracilaria domingensis]
MHHRTLDISLKTKVGPSQFAHDGPDAFRESDSRQAVTNYRRGENEQVESLNDVNAIDDQNYDTESNNAIETASAIHHHVSQSSEQIEQPSHEEPSQTDNIESSDESETESI